MLENVDPRDTVFADYYVSDSTGMMFIQPVSMSYTVIDVLKFIWGLPWNNLTFNWVATLKPSILLATPNHSILPKGDREVVVYLDYYSNKYHIHKIMQFCPVGIVGVKSASHLINETVTLSKAQGD